jgi:hypothetical protein
VHPLASFPARGCCCLHEDIFPWGGDERFFGWWEGGRGNEALGEVLLCHVVLCRWLISFCFDRSLYVSRRVMVERSFFFPRGRERTRFVGKFASLSPFRFSSGSGHEGGCWWCVLVPVLSVCLATQSPRPGPVLSLWGWWRKKVSLVKDVCRRLP